MTGRGRRSPPAWLGRLAIGCLSVTLLLLTCGCGFFLPGCGQGTRPTREERTSSTESQKTSGHSINAWIPLSWYGSSTADPAYSAIWPPKRGLTPNRGIFHVPRRDAVDVRSDKQKGTDRYLAGKLAESTQNGYDFSPFSGEKLVGQAYVFSGVGTLVSYIVLLDGDAQIIGLWEDTYAPTAADAEAGTHWTFFNRVDD